MHFLVLLASATLCLGGAQEFTYKCDDGAMPSASGCCGTHAMCPSNCGRYTVSNEGGQHTCDCRECSSSSDGGGETGGNGNGMGNGGGNPQRPNQQPRPFMTYNCEKVMGPYNCMFATDTQGRKCVWQQGDHKCNNPEVNYFIPPFAGLPGAFSGSGMGYGGYGGYGGMGGMSGGMGGMSGGWNPYVSPYMSPYSPRLQKSSESSVLKEESPKLQAIHLNEPAQAESRSPMGLIVLGSVLALGIVGGVVLKAVYNKRLASESTLRTSLSEDFEEPQN